MADVDSVANSLTQAVGAACVINGQSAIPGRPVQVRRGVLTSADYSGAGCNLTNRDLVLVEEVKGGYHSLPWPQAGTSYHVGDVPCTVSASGSSSDSLTFSVSGTAAGVVAVYGRLADGTNTYYAYAATASDTAETLAAVFAAQITGATASGATLSVAGATMAYETSGYAEYALPLRRQTQAFTVSVWSYDPDKGRAAWGNLIDQYLADNPFFTDPDGTVSQAVFEGASTNNASISLGLYARDLLYYVRFTTTRSIKVAKALRIKTTVVQEISKELLVTITNGGVIPDKSTLTSSDGALIVTGNGEVVG